jgi:Protein of unknown function (DUF559)
MASPSHSTSSGLEISATTSGGSLGNRFLLPWSAPRDSAHGGGHNFANRESLDQKRTRFLASENILVLRFWNYQINRELG